MFPKIYKEYPPAEHLSYFIKCYWLLENTYAPGQFEQVLPDSSYELAYQQAAHYSVEGTVLPDLYIVGQLSKPLNFYATGTVRQWAVRFYPWGLQPFGTIAAIEQRAWMPADDVLPKKQVAALQAIMRRQNNAVLRDKLDDFFMQQLLVWQFSDRVLEQAFRTLQAQKGSIKIKDLADHCFVSQRQLGRKVLAATGQSPHDIASRLRFEKVRDAIMHNPDTPLTFLAHTYSYTDQSHLVKEFRQYMDITPSAYAQQVRATQPRLTQTTHFKFVS